MMLLLASCSIVAIDETKATVVEGRNLVERQDIVFYLEELDNVLRSMDVVGEVCL